MPDLYPGVHTLRVEGGARAIISNSTSTTAFLGIFRKGPVDEAVRITSWGQFVEIYGGHWTHSEASYAVEHYFLNGGRVAYIVRTTWETDPANPPTTPVKPETADGDVDAKSPGTGAALRFDASSPGSWGNSVRIGVASDGTAGVYDLVIRQYAGASIVAEEVYSGLSTSQSDPRFGPTIVNKTSRLVEMGADDGEMPEPTDDGNGDTTLPYILQLDLSTLGEALSGGEDGLIPGDTGWTDRAVAALRGDAVDKTGLYALDRIAPDRFSLMCIPCTSRMAKTKAKDVIAEATGYCKRNYAMLLVGAGEDNVPSDITDWFSEFNTNREYAAGLFPRVLFEDPDDPGTIRSQDPSGIHAGVMARTDAARGVWKTPAGSEAGIAGGQLEYVLSDLDQEPLNRAGVNCMRQFPVIGAVVWGGRTLAGADLLASEHKYVAVARTSLMIESSLRDGLQWVVFEPNDESLWGRIRLSVGSFMAGLHREGAFQGTSAQDAYFVRCDSSTTTQGDIDRGVVNIVVGFAPLKPAEFVIVRIQQIAGPVS